MSMRRIIDLVESELFNPKKEYTNLVDKLEREFNELSEVIHELSAQDGWAKFSVYVMDGFEKINPLINKARTILQRDEGIGRLIMPVLSDLERNLIGLRNKVEFAKLGVQKIADKKAARKAAKNR